MTRSKYVTIPAVVAGALGMGNAFVARAAEPTAEDLKKQIEQLVQLNEGHPYTYTRDELVKMLDAAMANARPRTQPVATSSN